MSFSPALRKLIHKCKSTQKRKQQQHTQTPSVPLIFAPKAVNQVKNTIFHVWLRVCTSQRVVLPLGRKKRSCDHLLITWT